MSLLKKILADHAIPIREIRTEAGLAARAKECLDSLGWSGKRVLLLSDPETREAMGKTIEAVLRSHYPLEVFPLPTKPHADMDLVHKIMERIQSTRTQAVVGIGSGVINDLAKYSSFLSKIPYCVFGTAPSMNGYASISAAITDHGHKKSIRAHVPSGIFLDLEVLARAPSRLIRAGLGDSVCRASAQADWYLSHLLWDTPYHEEPFQWLMTEEENLFSKAAGLARGELGAIESLARTLILSGLGMTAVGGSYPASQGEHLISHWIEMNPRDVKGIPESFHGEQIGVTTLTIASIQADVLNRKEAPQLKAPEVTKSDFEKNLGAELGSSCWGEYLKKAVTPERAKLANEKLTRNWTKWQEELLSIFVPVEKIKKALTSASCPTTPQELGWKENFYLDAVKNARWIRDRYTFLDFKGDLV